MLIFIVLAAALVIISLLIIRPALFNHRTLSTTDLQEQNVVIARQRLAEVALTDDSASEEARIELEAALIDDLQGPDYSMDNSRRIGTGNAIAVMVMIPVVASLLYFQLGNHQWIKQVGLPSAQEISDNPEQGIELLLTRLEQVLEEQPDDAAGWELAARTYMGTRQFTKAERAYARLHHLTGDHPDTLTAWADASLMVNNNLFTSEISSRVSRALELDPNHIGGLWLAAMGARSNGSNTIALEYLNRLLPLLEGNDAVASETRAVIESLGGTVSTAEVAKADADARSISVSVSLSEELLDHAKESDTVFVFAVEKDGQPAPLAASRLTVGDLPTTLVIDRNAAMIAGRTVDSVAALLVQARVALGGTPAKAQGDLESGSTEVTARGESSIALLIDSVVTAEQ